MKLKAIYDEAEKRVVSRLEEAVLIEHIEALVKSGKYKDLTIRIPWDIINAGFSAREVCSWYEKYDCNDNHITTLFRQIIKRNYPKAWSMITDEKYRARR